MYEIEYTDLRNLDRGELLSILNNDKVHKHLISHAQFNEKTLENWILDKLRVDSLKGCKVRGVRVGGAVAG